MKKPHIFLLNSLLCVFILFGCAKSDPAVEEGMTPPNTEMNTDHQLSLAEARGYVEGLLSQIDIKTRGEGDTRKILDFYCVGNKRVTRSEQLPLNEVASTYVFNFEDDKGFAIVVGDNRIEMPVLALTDSGYLNPEEVTDNPGLINILSLAERYCEKNVSEAQLKENSCATRAGRGTPITYRWIEDWQVAEHSGRRTYLNWHQWYPFNDNVPLINDQRPPLGCVATATMLAMAWYKYPNTYGGHRFDWDEILKHENVQTNSGLSNPSAYKDLAKLGEIITRKENLDMKFGLSGSGASISDIPRTLKRLGYSSCGKHGDWNEGLVIKEITKYHYPVIVAAYDKRITHTYRKKILGLKVGGKREYYTYEGGHAFFLEEAINRTRRKKYVRSGRIETVSQTLVYVNYGWSGGANGYYQAGIFDTATGPVTRSTDGQYQYSVTMVYGVRI